MNDIFICKLCNEKMGIKNLSRHLFKIHSKKYKDYIKDNLEEFKHLNWKLCSECNTLFRGRSEKCGNCFTQNHKIQENQIIICGCCDQHIHSKVLAIHLKTYHNIKFLNYIKSHLKDFERFGWTSCVICNEVCRNKSKSHNQPTCSTKCSSELRKTWIGENSIRFGAILSDEIKNKISIGNIGKEGLKGDLNPACRDDVKKKISQTRIEKGLAKAENNGMYGKTHTSEAIKKIFSHRLMNKLEKIVAEELDKAKIPYHFQYFINEDGICKSYDFKIENKPLIIEVDGDFWHGGPGVKKHWKYAERNKQNDKLKEEMAEKRGIKIIRLWESDIKKDPSIVLRRLSSHIYS